MQKKLHKEASYCLPQHRRSPHQETLSPWETAGLGPRHGTLTSKWGQTILYSKFGIGVTDVQVQGELYCLLREDDVIGTLPRSKATVADIPELQPAGDRVLIKVQEAAGVSLGGVLLPDSAKERPIAGTVVRTGPGKREKDGARKAPKVKAGDQILYFKWAGDVIEAPSGDSYVVLHEVDILAKV
eukprot:jgi/Botrbrau1/21024/Bobra.0144s0037.1